jgi:hypothetical protein
MLKEKSAKFEHKKKSIDCAMSRKSSVQSQHPASQGPRLILPQYVIIMIRFVTNQNGGSNVQDTNCYLYKVSKVTAATDRTYWKYVAKERYSCRATAITITSIKEIYKEVGGHN